MSLKGALTHHYGPLPAWGWLLAGGGAIGLGLFLRSRSAATAAVAPSTDAGIGTYDTAAIDPYTGIPYDQEGVGGSIGGVGGSAGGDTSGAAAPTQTVVQQPPQLSDVISLYGQLRDAGLISAPAPGAPADDGSGAAVVDNSGATSKTAAGVGTNSSKATHTVATPSNQFTNQTTSETYKVVQKPSAAHGGAMSDYRFYPNRKGADQYVYVGPVSTAKKKTTTTAKKK